MQIEFNYEFEIYEKFFKDKNLEQLFAQTLHNAKSVLKSEKLDLVKLADNKKISVNIISDNSITPLNNQYREKNKPTDVLSWGFITEELQEHEAFGEVYISYETAKKQAGEKQHSLEYEFKFLFVHGLLHVFEYDHQADEEEQEMDALAAEIMK
jgi:probable rRNA maturation factor